MSSQKKHPLYAVWKGMKARCSNPNEANYKHYGARGIVVCEGWKKSLDAFAKDMGDRPQGYWLDRINNDQGYNPENCRWATQLDQQNNKRRTTRCDHNGRQKSLFEIIKNTHTHVSRANVGARVRRGWSLEKALTKPVGKPRI